MTSPSELGLRIKIFNEVTSFLFARSSCHLHLSLVTVKSSSEFKAFGQAFRQAGGDDFFLRGLDVVIEAA